MNNFHLKLTACICMLIDHIGFVLFPQYLFLRVIGRIAFPIFAYLITEGYMHTHSIKKYSIRLLIFALISQVPYMLTFRGTQLNIFFTLFIGLMALYATDYEFSENQLLNKILKVIVVSAIVISSYIFCAEYGIYGVLTILAFKLFKNNFTKLIIVQIIINIVHIAPFYKYIFINGNLNLRLFLQCASLLSLIFIKKYNGEKGKSFKYAFYAFYPVHILLLYIISNFLLI
ncbi:TraX family protein [Clostridium sp. UBA6640]|uniref:TraX family protein n=1 Tax=Clostridium sp. UBA6640 TaxID=1946370 RepID=UPI0025BAF5D1|nr:TraX family protein [Clostridium sp. UBA6640]